RAPATSGRDRTSRHRNRAAPSTPSVTSEGRVRAHESLDRAASLKASRTMQRSREVPAEGKRPALMPSAPCHEHSYRAVPPKGGGRAQESRARAARRKASRTMRRAREVPAEGKRPALMPSAPCHEHSYRAVPPKGGGSTARSPMPRRSQTSSESPSTPTGVEG